LLLIGFLEIKPRLFPFISEELRLHIFVRITSLAVPAALFDPFVLLLASDMISPWSIVVVEIIVV